MNTGFSISRLWKLIIKYAIENGRTYLLTILALFGCQAIFFIIWLRGSYPNFNETPLFIFYGFGLLVSGCVVASQSLSMLGSKSKGTYWLSVPAGHAEKLITSILYTTVVFFILFTLGFVFLRSLALAYIHSTPGVTFESLDPKFNLGNPLGVVVFAFLALQSVYMFGSVYFRRHSLVKTTAVATAFLFLYLLYCKMISDGLLAKGYIWSGLNIIQIQDDPADGIHIYSADESVRTALAWIFRLVWAPLFWVITWFRIREKQI